MKLSTAMEVAEILDKTTLVITGEGVDSLQEDDELYILSAGRHIRGTSVPLLIPKAKVVVTAPAGEYAIAQSQTVEETEPSPLITSARMFAPVTRRYRPALSVDEKAMIGNPARSPITIGDPVVRSDDLPNFVKRMAEEQADD